MQHGSPLLAAAERLEALRRRATPCSDVDFSCGRGTIHAILGENGAGKSTLIKIMAGVVQPDEGRMTFDGRGGALSPTRRRRTAPASSASSRNSP